MEKGLVGIVIVSHNNSLAEELINFCNILKQDDFEILNGGDLTIEKFGTNAEIVKKAVKKANRGRGVLIFVDMGSSLMYAKKAIKELEAENANIDVRIVDAPLVEGAVSAVAANFEDTTIEELVLISEDSRNFRKIKN